MFGEKKRIIMNVLNVQFLSSACGPDTRLDPVTEGHNLVADNLMYFDSICHAF